MSKYIEVKDFPGYLVGSDGTVKGKKGALVPNDAGRGYLQVKLYRNGKGFMRKVHRLVAEHFIPNPEGLPEVDHKDFDRANNRFGNLSWTDHGGNITRSVHADRFQYKLTQTQMQAILEDPRLQRVIAAEYGVTQSYVSKLKTGAQGPHLCRNT